MALVVDNDSVIGINCATLVAVAALLSSLKEKYYQSMEGVTVRIHD
jgi:hypothetical protein